MIYAALSWCPKAKGYKFRPPQCHAVLLALSAPVKCLPALQSSNCWACISIAPCKTSHWPKSHEKDLPPCWALLLPLQAIGSCGCSTPGFSSVSHSMCGAHGVKSNSFNSCQRLQRYQAKHLPRAKLSKWRCPRLQIKKWGMFKSGLRIACSISTMCLCYALIIL